MRVAYSGSQRESGVRGEARGLFVRMSGSDNRLVSAGMHQNLTISGTNEHGSAASQPAESSSLYTHHRTSNDTGQHAQVARECLRHTKKEKNAPNLAQKAPSWHHTGPNKGYQRPI